MVNKIKLIQRFSIKKLISLTITLVTIGIFATRATAAVTINVTQNGPNVQIIGTGTLNLDSGVYISSSDASVTHNFNALNSGVNDLFVGVFPTEGDIYTIGDVNTSGASPTSNPLTLEIGGDPARGVFVNGIAGGRLIVPNGYVSKSSLEFTAFIDNFNFTNYGLIDGDSIIVSWSNGAVNESLTMKFSVIPEPEPSTIALGGAMLSAAGSRRDENIVKIPAIVSEDLLNKSIVLMACSDLRKNIWEEVGTYPITNTTTMLCTTNIPPTRFYQAKIKGSVKSDLSSVKLLAAVSNGDKNIAYIPAVVSEDLLNKSIVLMACDDLIKNVWKDVGMYSITNRTTMLSETNALPTRFYKATIQ